MNFIKVRTLDTNKIGALENCNQPLNRGDLVVVDSEEKGEDVVKVLGFSKKGASLKYKFLRKVNHKDIKTMEKNKKESIKAFLTCKKKIKEHGLEMHLLKAYIPLNSKKIFFYYTAEERVDFRKLVKELARIFKKRIEMRQVGVRDAVQILGWVGLCGDVPCCIKFIENFDSISLKDIEEQNLPLSPSKFTGPCGRLTCCISFEKENYMVKILLPPCETSICFEGREVRLKEIDPLRNSATLESEERSKEIPLDLLLPIGYRNVLEFYRNCPGCYRKSLLEDNTYHEIATQS